MKLSRADGPALAAIAAGALAGIAFTSLRTVDPDRHVVVHEHTVVHEHETDPQVERAEGAEGSVQVWTQRPSGAKVRIVGPSADGEPLLYVDGVRVERSLEELELAPQDIDRIEVLKGEAALRVGGAAAANGVVQIFTKDGTNDDRPTGGSGG